jgi:hypothetical protein
MALLTLAPSLIVNVAPQYRTFGLGFYLIWAGAIGGLIVAFLRSRQKTTIQTTHIAPTPPPTTTPSPSPPPPPPSTRARVTPPRTTAPPPPPGYPGRTETPRISQPPPSPPPPSTMSPSTRTSSRSCPVCGGNTVWIPQQQRAYCITCKEYR